MIEYYRSDEMREPLFEIVQFILVFVVNVSLGRKFARYPAIHTFCLSKRARRFLFIVDIEVPVVSITAILWQIFFYLQICFTLVSYFIFAYDSWVYLVKCSILILWLGVCVPLGLYAVISEIILKRNRYI